MDFRWTAPRNDPPVVERQIKREPARKRKSYGNMLNPTGVDSTFRRPHTSRVHVPIQYINYAVYRRVYRLDEVGIMKVSFLRSAFVVLLVVSLFSTISAFAQTFQGGLRGTIRDQAGAIIPGVAVGLINEAT